LPPVEHRRCCSAAFAKAAVRHVAQHFEPMTVGEADEADVRCISVQRPKKGLKRVS